MAFITDDTTMMYNETCVSGELIDDTRMKTAVKTFLSAKDNETVLTALDAPENLENLRKVTRNILDDFSIIAKQNETEILPSPSPKETVRVFLRVKPKTLEESKYRPPPEKKTASTLDAEEAQDGDTTLKSVNEDSSQSKTNSDDDGFEVVTLESDYQVAVHAPESSATYKNSMNGKGKLTHRYTFTKIFPPETQQAELFSEMVLPRVEDFIQGRNQLLFTYGATCSGKTFTIQGNTESPGILPRALDVLFNTISDKLTRAPEKIIHNDSINREVYLRPVGFSGVAVCKQADIERIENSKKEVVNLGKELCAVSNASFFSSSGLSQDSLNSHASDSSLQSLVTMFPMLKNRAKDSQVVNSIRIADCSDIQYSVWISFAEIYNENIYDMLEKMPEVKRKGEKPRRVPLKLSEDRDGGVYIKGLKEIQVTSSDEAYQLLMIGRENLHFAATRLNHQSSRSHCIFNIKIIKTPSDKIYKDQPHMARISMLSFCDLAGSERIKKTLNSGERQKEAGNINTSLLVLGRVIKAIRQNQTTKDPKRHQVVPYRDSKLTRLFQSYFTGRGKASMVVNISQSPYLFDESLQVLKFSAIASKVSIETLKEQQETSTVKKKKLSKKNSHFKIPKKTRFSVIMEKKAIMDKSLLSGRGSIAWENPLLSSTQKIRNTLSTDGRDLNLIKFNGRCAPIVENDRNGTMLEEADETAFVTVNENDETAAQETTVIDQRYDGLLKVIENLKEQLIKEKQKNLLLERKTENVEKEVRAELCDDFNKMMVEIESNWEQRLQEEKDRAAELSEWRVNKMEQALREKSKKRKRSEDFDDEQGARELEMQKEKICALDCEIQEQKKENVQLKEQIDAMKDLHQKNLEEQVKERSKATRQSFVIADQKEKYEDIVQKLKSDLKATNEALLAQSAEPKIKELEAQLEEGKNTISILQADKANLSSLLDEAGEEYQAKDEELNDIMEKMVLLKNTLTESELRLQDLENEAQECRALLEEANARVEEKEFLIEEKDAQIMVLEERGVDLEKENCRIKKENEGTKGEYQCLKREYDQQEKDRWLVNKAKDQQMSELNDEVESLKEDKKRLKHQVEIENGNSKRNTSQIERQEEEISRLENETKSLIQAEKQQRDAKMEIEAEEVMLRKQVKDLTFKLGEVDTIKKKLKEKDSQLESTITELEVTRKESSVTQVLKNEFEALRCDREQKMKETNNLLFKIEKLQADVKNAEYDVTRLKEDKHNLMDHYEKQLKKKDAEMATLRKRFDPNRTVEILNNATPNKKIEQNEHEINGLKDIIEANSNELHSTVSSYKEILEKKDKQLNTLRKELTDKSDLIKNLASKINSPTIRDNDLQRENGRLLKELERVNSEHQITMKKQANASEMLRNEYKEQNLQLQNQMDVSKSKSTTAVKDSDEVGDAKNVHLRQAISSTSNEEDSLVTSPPASSSPGVGKRKRTKRGRARRTNTDSYTYSPILNESQNIRKNNGLLDLRDKISSKRNVFTDYSQHCSEERENRDPSLPPYSDSNTKDAMESSSSYIDEPQHKRETKSTSRKRKTLKKEVSLEENDQEGPNQKRSLRRSLRDRSNSKNMMPPPSSTKTDTSFLSPLIEGDGTITVTTTTTLSPQKTRVSFVTPHNRRKKLFNNTPANEVFTPPDTLPDNTSPHTVVKWQLRSLRSTKRNN